ncbi:14268_t:CDS:2 [Acaulospora morrowiae]|uniref:14268_t:CDS:1 n=1 Tax=Acaulospora morrowiae TaxID=94023 RepID=A0A9N8YUV9_9GLOM|nr:14268_t:CDS:2 [Acaulospora morrowiae]
MQIPKQQNSTTPASSNVQKGKAKMTQANSPMPGPVNGGRRNGDSPSPQLPMQDERFQRVIRLANERIDTYEIKRKLTDFLGEHASTYWNAIKNLIYCKIRRQDFERTVRPLLDSEHFELHNMMLFAILNNCIYDDPPPPPDQLANQRKRGREGDDDLKMKKSDAARDPKKRKMKELIMSLPKEDRERIKANKGVGRIENTQSDIYLPLPPPGPERLPIYNFEEQQLKSQLDPDRVPTCHQMKALPDHSTLFEMISQIANSHGIKNVSKDCADLLNYGLESHLKNIIGNCLQKSRSNGSLSGGSLGIRNGEQRYCRTPNQQKNTITARDLAFSFEMSPHILVQPGMARERLTSVALRDNEDYETDEEYDEEDEDEDEENVEVV